VGQTIRADEIRGEADATALRTRSELLSQVFLKIFVKREPVEPVINLPTIFLSLTEREDRGRFHEEGATKVGTLDPAQPLQIDLENAVVHFAENIKFLFLDARDVFRLLIKVFEETILAKNMTTTLDGEKCIAWHIFKADGAFPKGGNDLGSVLLFLKFLEVNAEMMFLRLGWLS